MSNEVPTLWFIKQKGCPACNATKPAVNKFKKKFPYLKVEEIDISEITDWPDGRWAPSATPTFVFTQPGVKSHYMIGQRSYAEIVVFTGMRE